MASVKQRMVELGKEEAMTQRVASCIQSVTQGTPAMIKRPELAISSGLWMMALWEAWTVVF
jgi:hypothetical protein